MENECLYCGEREAVGFGPYQTDPQICRECARELGIEVGEDK